MKDNDTGPSQGQEESTEQSTQQSIEQAGKVSKEAEKETNKTTSYKGKKRGPKKATSKNMESKKVASKTGEGVTTKTARMNEKELMSVPQFTQAFADWFEEKMIVEDLDVRGLTRKYPDICPSYHTVLRWIKKHPTFDTQIAYARECQVLLWKEQLDELLEEYKNKEYETKVDAYHGNNWYKTKIDVLKFKLAKLAPMVSAKYSSRASQNNSNGGGDLQITVQNYSKPQEENDDEEDNDGSLKIVKQ